MIIKLSLLDKRTLSLAPYPNAVAAYFSHLPQWLAEASQACARVKYRVALTLFDKETKNESPLQNR